MPEKSTFEELFDGRQKTMPPAAERNETRTRPQKSRTPGHDREAQAPAPKTGRGPGKRSNPDYKQFSVLLRKRTHMEVSHTLDKLGGDQDVSDLVEQLLEQWLERSPKMP
jgi:hypothetical protein